MKDISYPHYLIIMLYPYLPTEMVANVTGFNIYRVKQYAQRHGILKDKGRFENWEEEYIITHIDSGKETAPDVASALGRTRWSIINKYRELKGLRN